MATLTRRSFQASLVAAAGSVLLPTLKIKSAVDRERLFGAFCDAEAGKRYDLTAPFIQGGHAFATDGRVMARIDPAGVDTDPVERRIPREAAEIWDRVVGRGGPWQALGIPRERDYEAAPDSGSPCECGTDCPLCGGVGEVYCGDERFSRCAHCGGSGLRHQRECRHCHGSGEWRDLFAVGGEWFDRRYVQKIVALPGAEIKIGAVALDSGTWQVLLFRSTIGIDGLCMPRVRA